MITDADGNPAPRFKPPPRPKCAARHNDPTTWKITGQDDRGYDRLVCKTCKRFIGYRPPPTKKETERAQTQNMEPQ